MDDMESKGLRSLVETIIEKKSITEEEQKKVNLLAARQSAFDSSDFDAINRLTELICAGKIRVEGAVELQ